MAHRSPILGYNHNIGYRGLVFHVQTEDSGVDNPHIFTHLFHGGVIITSRRLVYDAEAANEVVKSLMQAQHKAVLKGLRRGEFDDKIDSYLGNSPDLQPRRASTEDSSTGDTSADARAGDAAPAASSASEPAAHHGARTAPRATTQPLTARAAPSRPPSGPIPAGLRPPGTQPEPPAPAPSPPPPPRASSAPAPRAPQAPPPAPNGPVSPFARTPSQPTPMVTSSPSRPNVRGNVLVSQPPIVVDSNARRSQATPPIPARPARLTPARTVREEPQDGLFDQSLISEKSLDEVILAYLSEDASED